MICPNCSESCADGTTFCPHCEAVLDPSILGEIPDDADTGEDTPVPDAAPPNPARQTVRAQKPAAGPRRRAPIDEEPCARAPEPEAGSSAGSTGSKYSQYWVDDEPPASKPIAAGQAPAGARPFEAGGRLKAAPQDPAEIVKEAWTAFLALHFEDKLTVISSAVLFFGSIMPWRTTTDGDDMGFLTWGLLTMLLAVGAVGAIWARKTGRFSTIPTPTLPMLSLGAGVFSAIVGVLFALTSFERGVQFGQMKLVSWPASGVFVSIVAAAGVIVGSILTRRRER